MGNSFGPKLRVFENLKSTSLALFFGLHELLCYTYLPKRKWTGASTLCKRIVSGFRTPIFNGSNT
jgi:hypothetical protein